MPIKPQRKKRPAAGLRNYRSKRDFKKTPEPSDKSAGGSGHMFVVQEHHARSHHYDFRLEIDGVLVSWAVPKGIPEDSSEKRLAVHVEDHPVEYGSFAGEIPAGNYGAGKVEIWDTGEWEPLEKAWKKEFASGKLKFALYGQKLHGRYLLARMGDKEPNWLMRKISSAEKRGEPPVKLRAEKAAFVSPQLARVVPTVPEGKEWLHEIKLDGYRLIAVRRAGKVTLFTRNELDWTDRFQHLAKKLEKLPGGDFVLDGEAVVFDEKGRSGFGLLQEALQNKDSQEIVFVVFDLLHQDGKTLRDLPLSQRQELLSQWLPDDGDTIRRSEIWPAEQGASLFKQACKVGLEGIISKQADGLYEAGSRRDWVKSKSRARQEFVICGYTPPRNSCPAFGALVLASSENGKLIPRGKVGTGFSNDMREDLLQKMKRLHSDRPPFPDAEKSVTWIKPELVAEVEFAEITRDGSIRQGSFLGLREDKPPADVHLDPFRKASAAGEELKVAGVRISHPDRLVYPADGISKGEVAAHYERVGDLMLPFVKDRPLAILRAPDGIGGQTFFQKSFKTHVPEHVKTATLDDGTEIFYIRTVKGLISLAQFGALEFHPWGATVQKPDQPDMLVWDLDPDEAVPWQEVLGAAFLLRDYLNDHNLEPIVKTSGGKGLHIVLPLKRNYDWEIMKSFTKAVAVKIGEQNPRRFVTLSTKAKRKGKIYIDYLRNGRGATCIAPWALRARAGAPVSCPVNWDDLPAATAAGFTIREPFLLPSEWKSPAPQTIKKAMLTELGIL
jgi:bifunctional non-homologous end joining protein LigD